MLGEVVLPPLVVGGGHVEQPVSFERKRNKQGMIPLIVGPALSVCPKNPKRLNFPVPIIDSMGLFSGVITVPEFPVPIIDSMGLSTGGRTVEQSPSGRESSARDRCRNCGV